MGQREPLSTKEIRVVRAKVKADLNGQSQQVAAQEAFPNQKPGSAAASMSRELKKVNVQEAVAESLIKHGITLDSALKPIADGLKAEKVHIVGNGDQAMADVVPDHSIRLKASGMALNLMGVGKQAGDVTMNFIQVVQDERNTYES